MTGPIFTRRKMSYSDPSVRSSRRCHAITGLQVDLDEVTVPR